MYNDRCIMTGERFSDPGGKPMSTRTIIGFLTAAFTLVVAAGCSSKANHNVERGDALPRPAVPGAAPAPQAAPAQAYPVIVQIRGRTTNVTIAAGPHGPLYSAASKATGEVLVSNATLQELKEQHADVY